MALVSFPAKLCHLAALAASASLGWPDQERSPWARSGCHPKTFISEASCDAWLTPIQQGYNSQTHMPIACNCSAAYQTVLRNIATWFLLETKGPTKLSCPWHSASCARMQVRTVQLPNRGGWLKGRWDSHGGLQLKCLRSLRSIVTLMIPIELKPNMERQFVVSENHLWLSSLRCCFCMVGDKSATVSKDLKGMIIAM